MPYKQIERECIKPTREKAKSETLRIAPNPTQKQKRKQKSFFTL